MTLAIVVAVFILASIAGAVGYSLWNGVLRRRAWDAQFVLAAPWYAWKAADVGAQRLALHDAVTALILHGPWSTVEVDLALADLHLVVHETSSWTDPWGRKVAGLADCGSFTYPVVSVGSDFAALAHELVEVMLQKVGLHPGPGVPEAYTPLAENWWTSEPWGVQVLVEYEKRRQTWGQP